MEQRFIPITDETALQQLFERSRETPVLLFKHDPACGISFAAYREMSKLGGEIPLIDVAHDRDLSLGIAAQTGVKHESPQVILLRDGRAVWSASHFDITAAAVMRAAREHGAE